MAKTQRIEQSTTEQLAELKEQLAGAQGTLASATRRYGRSNRAVDGVAVRKAQAALERIETEVAAIEERAVADAEARAVEARKAGKREVAKLAATREELAARVDMLVDQLGEAIEEWRNVDAEIVAAWPGPKGHIPVTLGRSRVYSLMRQSVASYGSKLPDAVTSPSQAASYRKAAEQVRAENASLTGAL